MQLEFDHFDGRSHTSREVIDRVTGRVVGHIQSNAVGFGNSGGIRVTLFDGKYATELNSRDEVRGFIRGVQAVLNHVVRIEE